ncbi:hypothetical protein PTSG_01732 [Salpingoeca rosetta]|uniref:PRELI/MSF1 domain-containing protein n=1 Tax=Salpingoeca rosetta (strain ATCC 50818 / BSB-021) TaxID=946362 RepID=F2TYT0_SALR5|nr:uncharacterized protein PTSG_01732 [Salpingoeca rosetta]EGD78754.1 hypothetical protein PTSG_01732 [Salpingoeca rosetta]|eukprot:XP_004997711.1 hypothetical protein PTSG_01732 [Salpingoeca rosetta]
MKKVRFEFDVDAPWPLALLAYDRKSWGIPNPAIKEVLKCDFSDWDVNPQLQQTSFKRRVQFRMPFPGWFMKLLTNDREAFLEFDTLIDRKNQHAVVHGVNLTMRHVIEMTEDMEIFADPDDPRKTKMVYVMTYQLKFSSWVSTRLENLINSHYGKALKRGRTLDHKFIQQFKRKHSLNAIPLTRSEQSAMEIYKARLDTVLPERASIASFEAEDIDSGTGNSKTTGDETPLADGASSDGGAAEDGDEAAKRSTGVNSEHAQTRRPHALPLSASNDELGGDSGGDDHGASADSADVQGDEDEDDIFVDARQGDDGDYGKTDSAAEWSDAPASSAHQQRRQQQVEAAASSYGRLENKRAHAGTRVGDDDEGAWPFPIAFDTLLVDPEHSVPRTHV